MKIFSFLPLEEIAEVAREHIANPGARIGQKKLAYELTKDLHGKEAADHAVELTQTLFSGEVASLSEEDIEAVFGSFKKDVASGKTLEDLLVDLGACPSKREARTLIQGNSISVNGVKVAELGKIIGRDDALYGKYVLIRRGKKNYYLANLVD